MNIYIVSCHETEIDFTEVAGIFTDEELAKSTIPFDKAEMAIVEEHKLIDSQYVPSGRRLIKLKDSDGNWTEWLDQYLAFN